MLATSRRDNVFLFARIWVGSRRLIVTSIELPDQSKRAENFDQQGESMQRPYAALFIHGLAKKPAPDKLREIWLWGITRDNPNPSVFAAPNRGINLGSQGVAAFFNYYADVFYGTDYETELQ